RHARTWEREQGRRIAAPTPAEVAAQRSPRQPVRSSPFYGYETESASDPRSALYGGLVLSRLLDNREPVREHVPGVEDLEPDSDLVHTRQVALPVRVTNIEHANGNLALHTPTDTTVEVSDDATNPGVLVSLRQTRHSVPHRSRDRLERGHVNAQPKFG